MVGVGPPLSANVPSIGSPVKKLRPASKPPLVVTKLLLKLTENKLLSIWIKEMSFPVELVNTEPVTSTVVGVVELVMNATPSDVPVADPLEKVLLMMENFGELLP